MHYRLKDIARKYRISYSALADAAQISKTALSEIINKQKWPRRVSKAWIRDRIEGFLMIDHNMPEKIVATIWQLKNFESLKNGSSDNTILRSMTMLTPQILDAIGVERDPFNSEMSSLFDLFLPKQHKLVLDKGLDAAAKCKFIAITGPVGTGKTIVKLALIERLKEKQNYMISEPEIIDMPKCLPATIIDSMLEDFMFLRSNTDNFKPIARKGSSRNKGTLEDRSRWIHSLLKIKVRDGKKLVLIIDEAHLLPVHTLKTLKRFHEMQDGFSKLLSIILIGQDELVHFLNGNYEIREVTARLNIVEMQPIPNLVKEYLNHKVQRAGGRLENLIDDSGLKAVKTLLNGERAIPISINNLVAKAVEDGYNLDALPVNAEIIENSYAKLKNL